MATMPTEHALRIRQDGHAGGAKEPKLLAHLADRKHYSTMVIQSLCLATSGRDRTHFSQCRIGLPGKNIQLAPATGQRHAGSLKSRCAQYVAFGAGDEPSRPRICARSRSLRKTGPVVGPRRQFAAYNVKKYSNSTLDFKNF